MIDYHVHSRWSGDSSESVTNACRAAIEKGLREICFTEHIDFDPTDYSYGLFRYEYYLAEIERARAEFSGSLAVRFGVEVDYQARFGSQIGAFLAEKQFDYVLGSAHYVDGIILEDHARYFPGRSAEEAYAPYFDNVLAVVEAGWFDALAHMDICKRHGVRYLGPFDPSPLAEQIDRILAAVIERGMSLEINTSGLRQSPAETYPGNELLRRYRELGGSRLVVGSDAHRAEDVGSGIETALAMAREAGFETVDRFEGRARVPVQLSPGG